MARTISAECGGDGREWKGEPEAGAALAVGAGAGADAAAVRLDDRARDGETEAAAAFGAARFGLVPAIEQLGGVGVAEAGTRILDGDDRFGAGAVHLDVDAAAGRRELERVADEVLH